MKPLNSDTQGCNPISSNCVFYQGNDIDCIHLCKGDTVSDVINKLGLELCEIMEVANLSNYDLSCLNLQGCNPATFEELIQLIVTRICQLNGATDSLRQAQGTTSGNCPDCVVPIAECFQYTNQFGDLVTTMQLTDYARTIGTRVCGIINEIANINLILANHEGRIITLENEPPPVVVFPQVTPTCVSPSVPTELNILLSSLEQQFCQLRSSTGLPNDIFAAIVAQCINLNASPTLGTSGSTMSSIPGWFVSVSNLAQSINNMWLTICDLRSAVSNIQLTCCPSGCDGVEINLSATFDGTTLRIYLTGTIPSGFLDCDSMGNLFTISDTTGGAISQRINVTSNINSVTGTAIVLTGSVLNLGSDFLIHTDACITNASTGATCQFCIEYTLDNTTICPTITLVSTTDTSISYSFNATNVGTYAMQLWDAAGTTVLQQNIVSVLTPGTQTGQFTGLTPSTNYRVSLRITIGTVITDCPFVPFTTTPVVCTAPTSVTGTIELPVECESCGAAVGFVSEATTEPGWYLDDNAPFLRFFDGAIFDDLLDPAYYTIHASSGGPMANSFQRQILCINNSLSPYYGYTFISDGSPASGTDDIYVWNGSTFFTTITGLVYAGDAPPDNTDSRLRSIVYDPSEDKIFYVHVATGTPYVYMGSIDLGAALAVNKFIGGGQGTPFGGQTFLEPYFGFYNPVNNDKSFTGNPRAIIFMETLPSVADTFRVCVLGGGCGNEIVTWGGGGNVAVDPLTGNSWIGESSAAHPGGAPYNTSLLVYDTSYTLIQTVNYSDQTNYRLTGTTKNMTCYCPVLNSIVALFIENGAVENIIVSFDAITYAETAIIGPGGGLTADAGANIYWSTVFNKLIYVTGSTITLYEVDGTLVQTESFTGAVSDITEDVVNNTIVIALRNAPPNNLVIMSIDAAGAISCTAQYADLFTTSGGNQEGPYFWNALGAEWDPAITWTVLDGGTTITVIATFGVTVQYGMLIYSTNGITWAAAGTDFLTPAQLAAGVTFQKDDIAIPFDVALRLTVLTDDDCGIGSAINYDYYPIS